jgi:predicted metalloprotease with PDZ domain
MTRAAQASPGTLSHTSLEIHYQVAMPRPESHLFEVTLHLQNWQSTVLDLKFPVWTPGSYLVREYAKHLQDFSAQQDGQPLPWQKVSKNHWQVKTLNITELTVHYQVFANELTVRTNHLDVTHGYFNPAAMFFYLPGFEQHPVLITIVPPQPEWQVTTPLPPSGKNNTFKAEDFDTLVDSPFEIGCHRVYDFEVLGKSHQLAIWGQGDAEPEQIIQDTQKVIQVEAELFDGLPYDRYVFLLHLSSQGYGGLEHKHACSLNYPRFGFRAEDKYNRFINLVAHEFFHLWNVKRIRPKALEVFDYSSENYTPSLWFSEGTTSYYDQVIPLRAGIYDVKHYLKLLGETITRLQTIPGRQVQSLSESSFDAWIKLYRPDANSGNAQISYYLKGEVVSLLLDLLIRQRHGNRRSLDDVMRQMWQQFGQSETGFTPEQLQAVIESVAGLDLGDFFRRYIHGTQELPYGEYLEPFGLQLRAEVQEDDAPYLGLNVKSEKGVTLAKFVETGSPAQRAGIDPGDELLAMNGFRVSADQLSDRLKGYKSGETVQLTVFHQDELQTYTVTLADPRPSRYQVQAVENPSKTQAENFAGWLGTPLETIL